MSTIFKQFVLASVVFMCCEICRAQSSTAYMPFDKTFAEQAVIDWARYPIIRDTITGKVVFYYADRFGYKITATSDSSYFITLDQWDPIIEKRDFFCRFKLHCYADRYEMLVDSLRQYDYSGQLENVIVDSSNVEVVGYLCSLAMLRTSEQRYAELFEQAYDLATPNTRLNSHMDLLHGNALIGAKHWREFFMTGYCYPILSSGKRGDPRKSPKG